MGCSQGPLPQRERRAGNTVSWDGAPCTRGRFLPAAFLRPALCAQMVTSAFFSGWLRLLSPDPLVAAAYLVWPGQEKAGLGHPSLPVVAGHGECWLWGICPVGTGPRRGTGKEAWVPAGRAICKSGSLGVVTALRGSAPRSGEGAHSPCTTEWFWLGCGFWKVPGVWQLCHHRSRVYQCQGHCCV